MHWLLKLFSFHPTSMISTCATSILPQRSFRITKPSISKSYTLKLTHQTNGSSTATCDDRLIPISPPGIVGLTFEDYRFQSLYKWRD